ncbi:SDR family NAD(P)-dependent oxidoreductase [Frondihabitans australicus]|uniref:Probable oxidoreductase n=1 Tax=Frondihabitans australicus TaxID=386892 RepID=A0A495IIP2_9MICO|nr:SDR family NAD(P)-dependent oxidoreductase [Frondihabitans australicus]RKR75853.1 NAD(P)-dependent dehydrogenase (short-subunit alcohol dehydrogenase family) [Frondihabitans australicus]
MTASPNSTPYGFATTTAEVLSGVDLGGKSAVVTGASSGLGTEIARSLAAAGAAVSLAVRDKAAGEQHAELIRASTGNAQVQVAHVNLADLASVNAFTAGWTGPLDILVNNAGALIPALQRTPQGWEKQFATHHLGHFALAAGLHDHLSVRGGRIVTLSSSGHLYSPVVFDDIHFRYRQYTDLLAYGQSKTANILFGVEAARRWAGDGITANAAMPGPTYTNFQRSMDPDQLARRLGGFDPNRDVAPPGWKTVAQGAATAVFLAASPLADGVTGWYYEDCNPATIVTDNNDYRAGLAPYAIDRENADRLWTLSAALLGR